MALPERRLEGRAGSGFSSAVAGKSPSTALSAVRRDLTRHGAPERLSLHVLHAVPVQELGDRELTHRRRPGSAPRVDRGPP